MTRPCILNAEPYGYSAAARTVLASFADVEDAPLLGGGPVAREALLGALVRADALIVRLAYTVDEALLSAAPRLRAVVSATTGVDHIDLAAAERRGVAVLTLRGETEFLRSVPSTAEHTWALLLGLLRRVAPAAQSVLAGDWERDRFRGTQLRDKTIGLVGLGRIGEKVAGYAAAFGMRVLAYDPYRPVGEIPAAERTPTLALLLAESDIVSLHVPLTAETDGLIGAAELAQMRPGAWLINTARGQIVDEAALLAALESGRLAGAALDVIADERDGGHLANPLIVYARTHENVLITPHIGGATFEAMTATEVFMAHKLRRFFEHTPR
jgi:D-3-phosphoglycerate dehydrogenase